MAHSWHIRARPWRFATVHRLGHLPSWFAGVRRFALAAIPKLRTRVRSLSPALDEVLVSAIPE
jgi:hypothetical protein